jgi:hypothetical protein
MVWEVQVRPFILPDGAPLWYKGSHSAVVSTLARNFKVYIQNGPNATVAVAPPRGKGGGAFYQVPKSTWLGGVLEAHLADRRSTVEQIIYLFQPWTWGRGTDGPGEGEECTRGDYLSDDEYIWESCSVSIGSRRQPPCLSLFFPFDWVVESSCEESD